MGIRKLVSYDDLVKPESHFIPETQILLWFLPIKIDPYNPCMNRFTRSKENKRVLGIMKAYKPLEFKNLALPCKIVLTRIAPRKFDYDNLVASFKFMTDTLADFLIPGLAKGRADGDKRLEFTYDQIYGGNGKYGVKVQIFHEEV